MKDFNPNSGGLGRDSKLASQIATLEELYSLLDCSLRFLFDSENRGSMFLRNVSIPLLLYDVTPRKTAGLFFLRQHLLDYTLFLCYRKHNLHHVETHLLLPQLMTTIRTEMV
jgi:hypothetical protein